MKIAFFHFQLMKLGGVVTYERQLYDMFKDGGHRVDIFAFAKKNKHADKLNADGYHTHLYSLSDYKVLHGVLKTYDAIVVPYAFCEKPQFEHIQAMAGRKIFLVVHDPAEDKLADRGLLRALLTDFAKFKIDLRCIFIRQTAADYYMAKYKLPYGKFILHPYKIKDYTPAPKSNLAICTSRIDFDKHTEYIIQNAPKIRGEVKLHTGWINRRYEFLILKSKYGWNGQDYYAGGFEFNEMEKIYSPAKVLIDMSRIANDGGGTQYTFLEAMNYGVAIVGNELWDVPNAEMIPDRHYILANNGNLAEKTNALLENETLRQQIVKNCAEILQKHDSRIILKDYEQFLCGVK